LDREQYWYKIIERKNTVIKTLFHGLDGSRILKRNQWLKAEKKLVRDGTSKTYYESGWHILPTYEECVDYLKFFKHLDTKDIVRCKAKDIRPKSHSRGNVYLADWILIED
jgi:hypothetical protein